MPLIPSALTKISEEQVSYRSALSEGLFFKIGGVINWIIDNTGYKVGDIQSSMLDEATFQAERTTDWVLMDGRSVIGSDYEALLNPIIGAASANIPDARGRVLRLKDNGKGLTTDLTLGTLQASQNVAHKHTGTPEHFGNVAVMRRSTFGLPDTFNDLLNTDNDGVNWVGGLTVPPAGTFKALQIVNPVATGLAYAIGGATGSTNVNKAWCEPILRPVGMGSSWEGDNGAAFSATAGGFGSVHVKGSTVPTGPGVGFNLRTASDGGSETRVENVHVNYFIKINN